MDIRVGYLGKRKGRGHVYVVQGCEQLEKLIVRFLGSSGLVVEHFRSGLGQFGKEFRHFLFVVLLTGIGHVLEVLGIFDEPFMSQISFGLSGLRLLEDHGEHVAGFFSIGNSEGFSGYSISFTGC